MSRVKIVSHGTRTELWVDGHMIGRDVTWFSLTQHGQQRPQLEVGFMVDELEVDADDVEIEVLK